MRIFLTIGAVKRPILHQRTKFRNFDIFQMAAAAILNFQKNRNFNGLSAVEGQYASSCQISSKSVKRLQTYGDLTVFKMAAVRHLGFVGRRLRPTTTTFNSLYRCAKFGENRRVVSITWNFQYFARLAWKCLFTPPKLGVSGGGFHPKNGKQCQRNPQRHILARVRVVWAIQRENLSTRLTCRWVHEKRYK